MAQHVAVIGAGAWGIALAQHFARRGDSVTLWSRAPVESGQRQLPRLPQLRLHEAIRVTNTAPGPADYLVFATPVAALREVATRFATRGTAIACCKGLEADTEAFPAEILARTLKQNDIAILSGPNFAHEVADGLPTAATIAAASFQIAQRIARDLSSSELRLYASDDLIGVQLIGAAKNVIAIAAGIAIGAKLGENARAALITRGLAELSRLNNALGGRETSLLGLSGVGDLILTCTSPSSRNFRYGHAVGADVNAETLLKNARQGVVEGHRTAPTLLALAKKHEIDMPIVEAVSRLTLGQITIAEAKSELLSRPLAAETITPLV